MEIMSTGLETFFFSFLFQIMSYKSCTDGAYQIINPPKQDIKYKMNANTKHFMNLLGYALNVSSIPQIQTNDELFCKK